MDQHGTDASGLIECFVQVIWGFKITVDFAGRLGGKISYGTTTHVREAIIGRGAILDTIIEGSLAEADVDRSTIFGRADYDECLAIW